MPCLRSCKSRAFSAQDDWLGFNPRQDFAAICDLSQGDRDFEIARLLADIPSRLLKNPSATGSTDQHVTVKWNEASGFEEEAEDAGIRSATGDDADVGKS